MMKNNKHKGAGRRLTHRVSTGHGIKKHQILKIRLIWFLSVALIISIAANVFAQSPLPSSYLGSTFKDSQKIQKKIFAKAMAQALNIPPAENSKCFKDLNQTDETSPFICGLAQAKIITATSSKKFLPNNQTDFGFAITSLCRAKNWNVKKNFKDCASYAKTQGILASPFPKTIASTKKATYKELSLLLDRTLSTAGQAQNIQSEDRPISKEQDQANQKFNDTIPTQQIESLSFTPVPNTTADVGFFDNIKLLAPLPTRFYKDEVYLVEGDVINKSASEAFVFLCPDKFSCDKSKNFLEKTTNNHFKISVSFKEIGNYQLGVIPGRSGTSKIQNISVLPGEPESSTGETPTSLAVNYAGGKTTFSWGGTGSLTRLTVFQNNKRRDYLFRQKTNNFSPASKDFDGFAKGKAGWKIQIGNKASDTREINLTVQDFYKVRSEAVQIKQVKETYPAPTKFTFQGKTLSKISNKAAFTLPNGQVKDVNFASSTVPAQTIFNIETNLDSTGTYIFEVNDTEGGAVINIPIFVGDSIPLLPDYFALNEEVLDTSPISNLNTAKQQLLTLINKDRANHSLAPVAMDNALNAIAQAHSQDMKDRNFFAHINPSNLGPDDRRKNAGYTSAVRENLGKAATLGLVEQGLMRSPVHRAAIIDPNMTRVGIGIVKDSEGYILATQNFSADPVTGDQLSGIVDELFNYANSVRSQNGLPNLSHNQTLKEVAAQWSEQMATDDFFSTTNPSGGQGLVDILHARNVKTAIKMYIIKASQKDQLREEILAEDAITDASNIKVGIGIGTNKIGEIFMTAIYTP
ncbi:MAG: CAP domain-containing protein [Candidatus Gracilibacteria bacterium]